MMVCTLISLLLGSLYSVRLFMLRFLYWQGACASYDGLYFDITIIRNFVQCKTVHTLLCYCRWEIYKAHFAILATYVMTLVLIHSGT